MSRRIAAGTRSPSVTFFRVGHYQPHPAALTLKLVAVQGIHGSASAKTAVAEFGEVPGLVTQFTQPVVTTGAPVAQFLVYPGLELPLSQWMAAIPLLAGNGLVGALELANISLLTVTSSELQPLMEPRAFIRSVLCLASKQGSSPAIPEQVYRRRPSLSFLGGSPQRS